MFKEILESLQKKSIHSKSTNFLYEDIYTQWKKAQNELSKVIHNPQERVDLLQDYMKNFIQMIGIYPTIIETMDHIFNKDINYNIAGMPIQRLSHYTKRQGNLNMIFGPPGSGKSSINIDTMNMSDSAIINPDNYRDIVLPKLHNTELREYVGAFSLDEATIVSNVLTENVIQKKIEKGMVPNVIIDAPTLTEARLNLIRSQTWNNNIYCVNMDLDRARQNAFYRGKKEIKQSGKGRLVPTLYQVTAHRTLVYTISRVIDEAVQGQFTLFDNQFNGSDKFETLITIELSLTSKKADIYDIERLYKLHKKVADLSGNTGMIKMDIIHKMLENNISITLRCDGQKICILNKSPSNNIEVSDINEDLVYSIMKNKLILDNSELFQPIIQNTSLFRKAVKAGLPAVEDHEVQDHEITSSSIPTAKDPSKKGGPHR